MLTPASPLARLDAIDQARRLVLQERAPAAQSLIAPWIERSWRRCLSRGHAPGQSVAFAPLSASGVRQARESSRGLTRAAQPVLDELGRALAATRYFAILTDAQGIVVDVNGPIDRQDCRADLITRIGVDLSEPCVGTTAIGAALSELQPVWLHRGEHFFDATSSYSCAGAPLFGPWGECVGMLDLTGVDAPERPELQHLAAQSARRIENLLTQQQAHQLLLRLNWPGQGLGTESDGLVGLDGDGCVSFSNSAARAMLPVLARAMSLHGARPHAGELFALPHEQLFDAARRPATPMAVPLWSGLQLQMLVLAGASSGAATASVRVPPATRGPAAPPSARLRDIESALIRQAVDEARGNVALAASRLGISRATVYRKLGLQRA